MRTATKFSLRFPRPATHWARRFALAALVGVGGGAAAAGLEWGLHHGSELLVGRFTHLGGSVTMRFEWGVLLLPALGGLLSGLIVLALCRDAIGHGTDVVTNAFHRKLGALPLRAPLVKAAASVGVISCGGSAGPEGPIAALGAALGSLVGNIFGVTPRERRLLLIAGCAAGIGAIFRCPLGGALFAATILYREPEFESEAVVPGFVASVVGYSTFMAFQGFGAYLLPDAGRLVFSTPLELAPYALLGLICAGLSIFFYMCVKFVERYLLPMSRLPRWLAPAVGGLATGALACFLPQVMDSRYLFVRNAMDGSLFGAASTPDWWSWARLFAAVALLKCVATAFTVGSGASGGVLGPSVFIGGVAGACLGSALEVMYPGTFPESLRKSLIPVGMGGVLAASMRTPLAAIVMATEMAGSYGLIVPSMLVCIIAYVIGRRWGLNSEQVRGVAESPAHAGDAVVHVLESRTVQSAMESHWSLVVPPNATLSEMVKLMRAGTRPVFAVVRDGRLAGLIRVPDLSRFMREPNLGEAVIAADMMVPVKTVTHPDDDLYRAMHVFRRHSYDVIPVVSRDDHSRWLGMLSRQRVFAIVQRHIHELYRSALAEHSGLAAIEQEGQLTHLLMGLEPVHRDRIQRRPVPSETTGKSLRQANFAQRFGTQVIAIEDLDGAVHSPPNLDAPLRADQTLVVIVLDSADSPGSGSPP